MKKSTLIKKINRKFAKGGYRGNQPCNWSFFEYQLPNNDMKTFY